MTASGAPTTLADLLRSARRKLAACGVEDAALDSRLLIEHFTGASRSDAIARPATVIESGVAARVEEALERRCRGEPVHRILGFREFYGLRLSLSPETLEPRPDTEVLVDALLPFMRDVAAREGGCRVLDLGTGTGAIALALLANVQQATATGVDISDDALATATRNAADLGLSDRFTARKSDWFAQISGRYSVIASNPPYIGSGEIAALQKEVRLFDPLRALDGGEDGLDPYRIIATGAAFHLEQGGLIAVEIGSTQRVDVSAIFEREGFGPARVVADLAGNDRVLLFATA
ncbi:peptide chain release factor N(5)-glutamine methyltransferase [Aquamicrobium ahrensii]|uniref:Release factor glutamine methyltransferase n=1 Tax=Aquamicrobium ahrensii TaxID=469551 RepID=A0ABV2KR90_9HYPH